MNGLNLALLVLQGGYAIWKLNERVNKLEHDQQKTVDYVDWSNNKMASIVDEYLNKFKFRPFEDRE